MTTKYTPGPWKATKYGYEGYSVNGENMVKVCSAWYGANARLIAAAPDLVEALMLFVWPYQENSGHTEHERVEKARKALSKALGDDFKG